MMSLPDRLWHFYRRYPWLGHVIFWSIYLLISVNYSKHRDGDEGTYSFEFITDALYMSAEMFLAYSLAYFVVPQLIYRKRYLLSIIGLIGASYVACVIGRIFIVKICEPMAGVAPKAFETYWEILTNIPKLFYVYYFDMLSATAIFVFLKVLIDQHEIQKRALVLEKEKAETELKLLKTQLNPHFLFNTLNNIYSLSLSSSPATSGAIARLADILDHILYRCNGPYVPLKAEIMLVKNYIELEKLRYDERLTVKFNTAIERDIQIAPLILLSLVENAFKHGAGDDAGLPEIDIDLEVKKRTFSFTITNSVRGTNYTENGHSNGGIGLNNLKQQLQLIYGTDFTLETVSTDNHFTVTLMIKLKAEMIHEKDSVLIG